MKFSIKSQLFKLLASALILTLAGCATESDEAESVPLDPVPPRPPVVLPTAKPAVADPAAQVKVRYANWKQSWADMRIDDYMSFYSLKAHSGKYGYSGIRQRKIRQWGKETYIQIKDVSPAKIAVKGNQVTVSALQEYNSTTWWDKGIKDLTWQKTGGRWLIVDERFTAYAQKSKVQPTPTPGHPEEMDVTKYELAPQDTDISELDTYDSDTSDTDASDFGSSSSSGGSSYVGPQDEGGVCTPGAMAVCNDGTTSYSANRRGTCSHHGGVARWCD